MDGMGRLLAQDFHSADADFEVLADLCAIEIARHAREFEFAMQRLI